ncbi:KxYKxGKxW signal peptide domain-containing protein [Vagococcus fluvialis]|uniref:KxYKxGKxW signal peptide domain-containing protein n=1 Tax=Vagococcus fluvialis TaxID=2738 RepID=UPI001A8F8204|nr:KxYKxGKxW signal peptide domain-containing protein [Vagococcus fluvialis]MBO0487008.1 GA module-containing protein [Vagococcus fluvialis]
MKRSEGNYSKTINAYEKKHKVKMYKKKKQWVTSGLVFGTLLLGGLSIPTVSNAAEWVANSPAQIATRIEEGKTSITMVEGDTVYNIGLAVNIKDPMSLLSSNGIAEGAQYTLPVGTVISWGNDKVIVTTPDGTIIGEKAVSEVQKHDANSPIGTNVEEKVNNGTAVEDNKKETSKDSSSSTNTGVETKPGQKDNSNSVNTSKPGDSNNGGTTKPDGNGNNGGTTDPTTPVKPVDPTKPTDPTTPVKPVDPVNPVDPTEPEEDNSLEGMKARLVKEEAKLADLETQLATATKELEEAKVGNVGNEAKIKELEAKIQEVNNQLVNAKAASADAQAKVDSATSVVSDAQFQLDATNGVLADSQSRLDAQLAEISGLQTRKAELEAQISAAQAEYDAKLAEGTEDMELANDLVNMRVEVRNIEVLDLPVAESNVPNLQAEVATSQTEVTNAQTNLSQAQSNLEAVQAETGPALAEVTRLQGELDVLNAELSASQGGVDLSALEAKVADLQTKVDAQRTVVENLKAEIAKKEEEIRLEKELKAAKIQAISTINDLKYLDKDNKTYYTSLISDAKSIDKVIEIVELAKTVDKELQKEVEEKAEAERQLNKVKQAASEEINELKYLTRSEKEAFNKEVNNQTNASDVQNVVNKAGKADKLAEEKLEADQKAKELREAKDLAISEIESLIYLDENLKENYIKEIEAVKSIEEITTWLEGARADNEVAKANHSELEAHKHVAINEVMGLKELTTADKDKASANIRAAKSKSEVNGLVKEAQALDAKKQADREKAEAEKKALEKAKQGAYATIEGLQHLNAEGKTKATNEVKSAKTIKEVEAAVSKAKQADQKAKEDKEKAEAEKEAAKKLQEAKDAANKQVDGMKYLTSSDKAQLKKSVNASKDVKTVNAVVTEAQALNTKREKEANDPKKKLENAKKDGTTKVNAISGLDAAGKDYYTGRIKEAKTELDVSKAVGQAEVDSKKYVSTFDKRYLRNQIEEAKTQAEIDRAVQTARNIEEDNAGSANDPAVIKAKKDGIAEINKAYNANKVDNFTATIYRGFVENSTSVTEINNYMTQFRAEVKK